MSTNWTCPYCNAHQTIVDGRLSQDDSIVSIGTSKYGPFHYTRTTSVCCSNNQCGEVTVSVQFVANLDHWSHNKYSRTNDVELYNRQILPANNAIPQAPCVPAPIAEDYYEACSIVNLSPKASATLTRRCLQGMIRNFCNIKKGRLIDEINELVKLDKAGKAPRGVTTETIEAIDHVRTIGNIGAHMEKDINHIVPIDPGDAEALIQLVEILFEEWYVAREKRSVKLNKIKAISQVKAQAKANPPKATP